MKLTMSAAIHARWGHRVDGLIHTHAWTIEATVEGPPDCSKVYPADELEEVLVAAVEPWQHRYLTNVDVGQWKGYDPLLVDNEPTVEELTRLLWRRLEVDLPGLAELSLVESTEFDRCRTVTLSK